jgi:serine/threonine-protein kinase
MQQQAPWLVANRYEVGEVVGRGGYGMVCRGLDRKTGQVVALKMLGPEAGRDRDAVERMLREQQALVALSGTCAVTAIDLCRLESGAPCLVMEWLEGQDLEQRLSSWESGNQRGPEAQLLNLLKSITQTLERAHGIGIVHRDIKPANIFLTNGLIPGARLLDFGLASMKSAAPLTEAGMVMGSPSYIAPETWRGNAAAIDGRADLYSLGVIVFRWLTGSLPFEAPDLIGKMLAVTTGPRPSAVRLRPELPRAIDDWFLRALAIEPKERFQSGIELHESLVAALHGRTLPRAQADSSSKWRAVLDGKVAFKAAFQAAAGLLRHFTLGRGSDPPPVQVAPVQVAPVEVAPAEVAPESSTGDRASIWLDSTELEEVAPPQRATPPPPPPPARRAPAASGQEEANAPAKPHGKKSEKSKGKKNKGKKNKGKKKHKERADKRTRHG